MIAERISIRICLILLYLFIASSLMAAEVRIYKETVKVPASGDEYSALQAAKQKQKSRRWHTTSRICTPGSRKN